MANDFETLKKNFKGPTNEYSNPPTPLNYDQQPYGGPGSVYDESAPMDESGGGFPNPEGCFNNPIDFNDININDLLSMATNIAMNSQSSMQN